MPVFECALSAGPTIGRENQKHKGIHEANVSWIASPGICMIRPSEGSSDVTNLVGARVRDGAPSAGVSGGKSDLTNL